MLLESYRYAEVAAAGKEREDDAGKALFGDTNEEEAAPRCHDHEETGAPPTAIARKSSAR